MSLARRSRVGSIWSTPHARVRLRPEDVGGGTFTVSNLGTYGVDSCDAIVNAPQAAILAVGRIVERVVPVDGRPAVRPQSWTPADAVEGVIRSRAWS
jgi:pyruvate/2-oxoglutarate dehydrogenase complex dihydrolipoamide acyltransferase (E2) component